MSLFLNYTGAYTDNRSVPSIHVASWTTADATAAYEFSTDSGLLGGLSAMLSVVNIANRDPPFVTNPNYAVNFDGANGNSLGRFLAFQVQKRW
jgi:outer membrane receptor protein involved in Fe transport